MFENIINFFRNLGKNRKSEDNSKSTAKERLHLVLMQDRANVSADFLDIMRQEIIEVIKKYVDVDESEIDVRMTNRQNEDGTNGAPALYANIPITNIKNDILVEKKKEAEKQEKISEKEVIETSEETVEENAENYEDNNEEIIETIETEENIDNVENIENSEEKNEPIPETINQN